MKIKYLPFITCLLAGFHTTTYAGQCSPTQLGAYYNATKTKAGKQEKINLQLWRKDQLAMHAYPNGTGEIWHQLPNQQMRLDKFFDQDKRLVEYESADLTTLGKTKTWYSVSLLFNPALLEKLSKVQEEGSDCELTETYQGEVGQHTFNIKWQPARKLLVTLKAQSKAKDFTESWHMEKLVTDPNKVTKAFDTRLNYRSTDFADIGDNEADPFFRKMINLGYIDHAPEAVYDAQGNNIAHPHHHGHSH